MSHEPDIFGYLATTKISGITTALLDDSTKNSYAAKKNVPFWKGPISIWATVRASRTYPHGLPIPEASGMASISMAPGESAVLQPPGTEIWHVKAIMGTGVGGTADGSIVWFDGTSEVKLDTQSFNTSGQLFTDSTNFPITWCEPLIITGSLYFKFTETGASNGLNFTVAYHKVSL
jgi:hypothetical protein